MSASGGCGSAASTAVSGSFLQSKHSRLQRSFVSVQMFSSFQNTHIYIYTAHMHVSSTELFKDCKRHPKMAVSSERDKSGQMFEHLQLCLLLLFIQSDRE